MRDRMIILQPEQEHQWLEIDHWVLTQRFGSITPTAAKASIPAIAETVKAAYTEK